MTAVAELGDGATIAEGKSWLRKRIRDGATCPCCQQFAKIYKRKLTASQIRTLAAVARRQAAREEHGGRAWVHLPEVPQRSRDFATVAYFGLAEEERIRRPDGGRAGWWRVTSKGWDFLQGVTMVPRYAKVYNGSLVGFEGPDTGCAEIEPEFNFAQLMAGR